MQGPRVEPPPAQPGFTPAQDQQMRVGAPEGLNPFGATMSPDERARAAGGNWADPAAFAATAPPMTREEHEQAGRSSAPPMNEPSAAQEVEQGPRTLAGFMVSYEDNELGIFWPLYQGKNLIGRKGAAAGLDVEIDHPTTSSRHAIIFASARPGKFEIEDPGSTNGTFINDARLETGSVLELHDGDHVRFGGFVTTVKII
jgi:FHA domain